MPISPTNRSKEDIVRAMPSNRWRDLPLAYLHVSEPLAERGQFVHAICIWRWLQARRSFE